MTDRGWESWIGRVAADLGIPEEDVDLGRILDLTRDVAHGVARPAAPTAAYLAGYALGRGTSGDAAEVFETIVKAIPPTEGQ